MPGLFDAFDRPGLTLPNRIVMSPRTRTRARVEGAPTELMRDYYAQRATAGLIFTECIRISEQGHGISRRPVIHDHAHIDGWKRVTDAVHTAGARMFLQIGHCGRGSHPDMRGDKLPVAPSPITAPISPTSRRLSATKFGHRTT